MKLRAGLFSDVVIRAIAEELECAIDGIQVDASLVDDLHMDSLAMLSLVARVEDATGSQWVAISEVDLASATVADLLRLDG